MLKRFKSRPISGNPIHRSSFANQRFGNGCPQPFAGSGDYGNFIGKFHLYYFEKRRIEKMHSIPNQDF
jgi:hypothetical protein